MVGAIQNPARLGTLTASEISLLAAVNQLPTERRHTLRLEPPAGHATISAPFLRWLLLEAVPALRFPAFRVELRNATIAGLLDLSRATLPLTLCFRNCRFASGLDLTEARTGSFEMIGGSAAFVNANRMNSEGALLLRAPLENPAGGGDQIPKGWLIIEKDLRLAGARIRGNLDLRGCSVGHAESPGRNHIAVRADGLKVDGSVRLTNGFRAIGQVSLNGARIERNLNCSGAVLWNPGGYSLSAAGAHIAGSLYTRSAAGHHGTPVPFLSDGAFRLEGARIVGDWKAGGAHFVAPATRKSTWNRTQANILELRAIMANGLTVNATVSLDAACHIRGTAEFINAKIGGDLNCNGAIFDFPGEEVLYADGITISGTFFLENARVNGLLRLVLATISQDFFVNKTIFDLSRPFRDLLGDLNVSAEELGLDVCGIYAPTSRVGGSFYWRRIRKSFHQEDRDLNRRLLLSVLDADAERVEDDRESWELLDQIDVRNCRYQSIANLTGDTMWRAELLDLAYAPINQFPYDRAVRRTAIQKKLVAFRRSVMVLLQGRHRRLNGLLDYAILTFAPQPYMQLARVVHRTGYEAVANDIMVRMERNRTRYSGFGRWRQLGRWVSDILIRYGFSPLRPVWFLLGWTVVSAVIFEYAFANNRMRPTFENLENDLKPGEARYEFNPVIYALDTLVPLIDLNQKKNWHVEPLPEVDQKMARHRAEAMKEHPASLLMAFWRLRYSLPNSPIGFLVLFNTFFGWVLTTFLAAGVTGVLRSKPANEGGSDSGQE